MTISDFESHRRENAARREAENHREAAWGRGVEKRLRIIASLQEELGRQRKEQEKTDEDQRQQESMLSRRCPLRYLPIPDTRYPIPDTRYSILVVVLFAPLRLKLSHRRRRHPCPPPMLLVILRRTWAQRGLGAHPWAGARATFAMQHCGGRGRSAQKRKHQEERRRSRRLAARLWDFTSDESDRRSDSPEALWRRVRSSETGATADAASAAAATAASAAAARTSVASGAASATTGAAVATASSVASGMAVTASVASAQIATAGAALAASSVTAATTSATASAANARASTTSSTKAMASATASAASKTTPAAAYAIAATASVAAAPVGGQSGDGAGSQSLHGAWVVKPPPKSLRWDIARDEAEMVLSAACAEVRVLRPCLDIAVAELLARVSCGLREARSRGDGTCYIGSTSDPLWRWQGGLSWRGDALFPERMPGHRSRWRTMIVVGGWPDRDCREAEVTALRVAAPSGQLTNRVLDARGLGVRPHAYSFVYVCLHAV